MRDRAVNASWRPYVVETNPNDIARAIGTTSFVSAGVTHPLVSFEQERGAPCVLVSQGTGGHAYVFAELAYRIHERGYSVFIMPKHGGATIDELVRRHRDAVAFLTCTRDAPVGVYGEGLGGYACFYLALGGGSLQSIALQNGPAILTEKKFLDALFEGIGAARRRRALWPLVRLVARALPRLELPTSVYLDFREMVDSKPENHAIETKIVDEYLRDPGFDRRYPLAAITSLLSTPPPAPLSELRVPTMFLLPERGITPAYERDLFARLPDAIPKKLVAVDGGVFWMVSHPRAAARVLADWFDETLERAAHRPLHCKETTP